MSPAATLTTEACAGEAVANEIPSTARTSATRLITETSSNPSGRQKAVSREAAPLWLFRRRRAHHLRRAPRVTARFGVRQPPAQWVGDHVAAFAHNLLDDEA
jgi:hypothetical protein